MNDEISNFKKPYLFRYRSNNEYTIDEIKNSNIYFADRDKLNDPFDASHKLIDINKDVKLIDKSKEFIKNKLHDKLEAKYFESIFSENNRFLNFIEGGLNEFINKTGIACFTISPVNIMLWAMYANNHQGICIQYNTDNDDFFFKGIRAVKYVDKLSKIDYSVGLGDSKAISNVFFTKLGLWKNEYEVRLIKTPSGIYKFNSDAIRSIIFGLRSTDEFRNQIIEVVKLYQPHIKLYNSELLDDGFGLQFRKIIIK